MSQQTHQPRTAQIKPRDPIAPGQDDLRNAETAAEEKTLTNAELRQLAAKHRPPIEWFAGDEEDIF